MRANVDGASRATTYAATVIRRLEEQLALPFLSRQQGGVGGKSETAVDTIRYDTLRYTR